MKFERIVLNNFMRYKGENRIDFSCDDEKNVTVVLGDNTVGKTTLAQAFRFVLYGEILVEDGKKKEDYVLLNKDVIEVMDANSQASVAVELVILNEDIRYLLKREIVYGLKLVKNQLELRECKHILTLRKENSRDADAASYIKEEKIQGMVDELFPRDMSNYFLFDGEKWRDIRRGGIRDSIKESVHKMTGLSAAKMAMYHLKDMGSGSAISKMKKNIQGSGQIYDNIQRDVDSNYRKIEKAKEKIALNESNIRKHSREVEQIEKWLEENKSTEEVQKSIKNTRIVLNARDKTVEQSYKALRNQVSAQPWAYFARPMLEEALAILKKTSSERRDIPHMHQSTIDYLIRRGMCICGTPIHGESEALEHLLKERNYLPPADIGSLLGSFEKTAQRWQGKYERYKENVMEAAADETDAINEYDQTVIELQQLEKRLEQQLDGNLDFGEKRNDLKYHREQINALTADTYGQKQMIETYQKKIERLEQEKEAMELKNKNNQMWRQRIVLAEELYQNLSEEFDEKEKKLFFSLNQGIQKNFDNMFNAKDKRIYLDSNYQIMMSYRNEKGGYSVENNLSEGEKIARNFAFIVTIMEYAQNQKSQKDQMMDTLPLVLDGPFSKLGQENIGLVAGVLPKMSEQVIIFMLKKDWDYTMLDQFVGKRYEIDKRAEESYATIKNIF